MSQAEIYTKEYQAREEMTAEDYKVEEYNVDLGEWRSGSAYQVTVGGVTLMHTCTEGATAAEIAEGLNAHAAAAGVPATFSAQGARQTLSMDLPEVESASRLRDMIDNALLERLEHTTFPRHGKSARTQRHLEALLDIFEDSVNHVWDYVDKQIMQGDDATADDAISPKRYTKTDLEQMQDRLNRRWVMPSLTDEQYAELEQMQDRLNRRWVMPSLTDEQYAELKQRADREANYYGISHKLLIIDDIMREPAQTGRSPSEKKGLSDAEIVAYAGLEEHLSTFDPVDRMRATSLLVGDIRAGMNEHFPLSSIPVYSEGEKADMMNKVRRTLEGRDQQHDVCTHYYDRSLEYNKCTDAQGNQIGDILADLERIAGVPFEYDAGEKEYQSDVEDHVLTVDLRFGDMCMWYIDYSQIPHDCGTLYVTPQDALRGYLSQIREMFSQVPET